MDCIIYCNLCVMITLWRSKGIYSSVITFTLSLSGSVFAWGMGTNLQLGTGEEDDEWSPVEMSGKQLENRVVVSVSSGGQHTVLLVKDKQES